MYSTGEKDTKTDLSLSQFKIFRLQSQEQRSIKPKNLGFLNCTQCDQLIMDKD